MAPQVTLVYDTELSARHPTTQYSRDLSRKPPAPAIILAVGASTPVNRKEVGGLPLISGVHASFSVGLDAGVAVTPAKGGKLRINDETTALPGDVPRSLLDGDVVWLLVNPKKP